MTVAHHAADQLGFGRPRSVSFRCYAGDDDVVILGKPTLKLLGIDVYDSFGARARERAALIGVDTASYRQCRLATFIVDALHQPTSLTPRIRIRLLSAC